MAPVTSDGHWHLLEAELRDQGHDAHDFGMR
jgi:hypothetical protein